MGRGGEPEVRVKGPPPQKTGAGTCLIPHPPRALTLSLRALRPLRLVWFLFLAACFPRDLLTSSLSYSSPQFTSFCFWAVYSVSPPRTGVAWLPRSGPLAGCGLSTRTEGPPSLASPSVVDVGSRVGFFRGIRVPTLIKPRFATTNPVKGGPLGNEAVAISTLFSVDRPEPS